MRVALLTRHPRPGQNFSVELIVEGLRTTLHPDFVPLVKVSRFESNGILQRVYNILEAALRQEELNHVTGDVNFLTYLLRRRSTVLTVLDCGRISGRTDLRSQIVKLFWFTIPVRRCAAITVISGAVKEDLLRQVRIDPDKVHVVPVAVPSQFSAVPKAFDAQCPVILQVGTKPNKNLERLCAALEGIRCRLDIVGVLSEAQREVLERHAIDFRNFVGVSNEEMFKLYQECDMVAFASTFEGFGMPIVEGNRVGRPVLTGNVASMPEVAGDAACLVDPFDVASIRAGMQRILSDAKYRQTLVENGYRNAKRYELPAIANMYETVYRKVLGGPGAPS